jgi:hypothetical protein
MDARPATNPIRRRKSLLSACNKSRSSSKQLIATIELHFSGVVTMQTYINQCIAHCSVHLPYCETQHSSSRPEYPQPPTFPAACAEGKTPIFALERTFFTLRDIRCRRGKNSAYVCAAGFLCCVALIAI